MKNTNSNFRKMHYFHFFIKFDHEKSTRLFYSVKQQAAIDDFRRSACDLKFGSNCAHHKQLRYKKHQQSHANMWFLMEITCSFYQIISWKNWHVGLILTNKKDRKINMRLNQLLFFFPGLRRMLSFGERSIWKRK